MEIFARIVCSVFETVIRDDLGSNLLHPILSKVISVHDFHLLPQ